MAFSGQNLAQQMNRLLSQDHGAFLSVRKSVTWKEGAVGKGQSGNADLDGPVAWVSLRQLRVFSNRSPGRLSWVCKNFS